MSVYFFMFLILLCHTLVKGSCARFLFFYKMIQSFLFYHRLYLTFINNIFHNIPMVCLLLCNIYFVALLKQNTMIVIIFTSTFFLLQSVCTCIYVILINTYNANVLGTYEIIKLHIKYKHISKEKCY